MHIPWSLFKRRAYAASQRRIKGFPLHYHDHPEVFWIMEGQAVHEINGFTQRLETGALVLIRPTDKHAFRTSGKGILIANVGFPEAVRVSLAKRLASSSAHLWTDTPLPAVYSLTDTQLRILETSLADLTRGRDEPWEVERFLFNLMHLLADGGLGGRKTAETKLEAALSTPAQQSSSAPDSAPAALNLPPWLQRACVEIQKPENFMGGTQRLAQLAGRSPGHLAREVRRLTGRSPTDIVNEARMRHAAHLLLTTENTVISVTLDCGFQGLGHFYRAFQAAHGLTPRAFRLRQMQRSR
jgi:AraC family cel operon transcriptional repressor